MIACSAVIELRIGMHCWLDAVDDVGRADGIVDRSPCRMSRTNLLQH